MKNIYWRKTASLGVSVKNRNDYADYDYLDKLNKQELDWFKGFHREYVNADFKHTHRKIYKGKKQKRSIYGLNNSRNRDVYGICKVRHKLILRNEKLMDVRWYAYCGSI